MLRNFLTLVIYFRSERRAYLCLTAWCSWSWTGSRAMGWDASTSEVGLGREALEYETDIKIDVVVAS